MKELGPIFLLISSVLIFGIYSLIKGYKNTLKSQKDTYLHDKGKRQLKIGTIIFVVITISVIIGFSVCLSIM